jgi:hypothetical protein
MSLVCIASSDLLDQRHQRLPRKNLVPCSSDCLEQLDLHTEADAQSLTVFPAQVNRAVAVENSRHQLEILALGGIDLEQDMVGFLVLKD